MAIFRALERFEHYFRARQRGGKCGINSHLDFGRLGNYDRRVLTQQESRSSG